MYTPRKFWLALIGAVLAMVVIACSCGSLTPTPTAPPPPTVPPPPTIPVNPIPALAGYWLDTDTQVVHTIEWQNGQYVVISAIDAVDGSYPITDQSWLNNTLMWTYYRSSTDVSVTFETVSVTSDILNTKWTNSDGDSGTWTLERVSSPIPSAPVNQEPIPGLAGKWEDPATLTVHTIAWIVDSYVVNSSVNPDNGTYDITEQHWDGSTLTWTYYVAVNDVAVTIKTISVDGDTLNFNWSQTTGESGTDTYTRVP